jgi:hypothetical protein
MSVHKLVTNGIVLVTTVVICIAIAEGATRLIDGLPLTAARLPPAYGGGLGQDARAAHLDGIQRAASVAREWFFSEPPPLPNRKPVPREWVTLYHQMEAKGPTAAGFMPVDAFKAWNAEFVGDPCEHNFFASGPGSLFVYDPPAGDKLPPYRFLPDTTTPAGLVTNQFGWRGPPVPFARSPRTIRIVFVGASTIAGPHQIQYALPELVSHWLNLWAAARRPDIRFEVMNAARESLVSTMIAAVVRQEVAPLRPDLVIYYEGGNNFRLDSLISGLPPAKPRVSRAPQGLAGWLQDASRYSAVARRLQSLVGFEGISEGGRELQKPDYEFRWPQGLNENDPDLAYPDLPVSLTTILKDFDQMRADLATVDSEFVLTSFKWMVRDGMVLNPIRNKVLWENLNYGYFPVRYRDLERLAAFQNRVFAKYAAVHGVPFIDVAGRLPSDPDIFADAVHESWPGMHLKAWVILQQLVAIIEQRLASGAWPKPVPAMADAHPGFAAKPRQITVDCGPARPGKSVGASPPDQEEARRTLRR